MLRNVAVLAAIEKRQIELLEKIGWTVSEVINRFHKIYLQATRDRDHGTALRALEDIGKHLGTFEQHNSQKQRKSLEEMRRELEQVGFDFSRTNFPSEN